MTHSEEALREQFGLTQVALLESASFIEVIVDDAVVEWLGGHDRDSTGPVIYRKVFIRTHLLPGLGFSRKIEVFSALVRDHLDSKAELVVDALSALRAFNTNRNMVVHGHFHQDKKLGSVISWSRTGKTTNTPLTKQVLDGLVAQAQEASSSTFQVIMLLREAAAEADRRTVRMMEAVRQMRDE